MNSNVTFNSKRDDVGSGILFCSHDNQNKYYGKTLYKYCHLPFKNKLPYKLFFSCHIY